MKKIQAVKVHTLTMNHPVALQSDPNGKTRGFVACLVEFLQTYTVAKFLPGNQLFSTKTFDNTCNENLATEQKDHAVSTYV